MVTDDRPDGIGTFPNLGEGLPEPWQSARPDVTSGLLPSKHRLRRFTVKKIHVALIAGLIALAALAGTFAAARTTSLGAAGRNASPALMAKRTRQLDAYAAALNRALKQKPPALPAVPTTARGPQGSPAVIYRRPAPIVVVKHTHHGDDQSEHAEGGGFDD
jgi:hypothetical protein